MNCVLQKINKKLLGELKTFGFFHCIRKILYTTIYKRLSDSATADRAYAKSSYHYVERFYKKHTKTEYAFNRPINDIAENEFVYWTCWLQGMEAAPAMVKACVNSAKKYSAGHRIIIISYENIGEYVSLPEFILEKHRRGHISAAHFADILRTYLLYTYGGVWFDATVFFTREIPAELLAEPVFFFRSPFDDFYCPVSNWFIIAEKRGNPLLFKQLCALCAYWRVKNTLIDYFFYHYFLQVLINRDGQCAQIFNAMAYHCNQNPHYLQTKLLFSEFVAELWDKVRQTSFCHKLVWKTAKIMPANSFFHYIEDSVHCT